MMDKLTKAMADIEDEQVINLVETQLSEGREPFLILGNLKEGMDIVGKRFSDNEYFLVELVISADVFQRAMDLVINFPLEMFGCIIPCCVKISSDMPKNAT